MPLRHPASVLPCSGSSGAYLLAHCPWRVALPIVAAAALANRVLLRREMRPLARGA